MAHTCTRARESSKHTSRKTRATRNSVVNARYDTVMTFFNASCSCVTILYTGDTTSGYKTRCWTVRTDDRSEVRPGRTTRKHCCNNDNNNFPFHSPQPSKSLDRSLGKRIGLLGRVDGTRNSEKLRRTKVVRVRGIRCGGPGALLIIENIRLNPKQTHTYTGA